MYYKTSYKVKDTEIFLFICGEFDDPITNKCLFV